MADGLSEATFLLFSTISLLFGVRALSTNSRVLYALCGVFGGLAYLTRPEGGLILAATAIVFAAMQFSVFWRRSWSQFALSGTSMVMAATIVSAPYIWSIGSLTTKPTPKAILGTAQRSEVGHHRSKRDATMMRQQAEVPQAGIRRFASASLLSVYAPDDLTDRYWWALKAVGTELFRAGQYVVALAALLGIWCFRARLRSLPGAWMLLVLCGLHTLVLWRLAILMGYVSDRHVLILVLCTVFPAAAAASVVGRWLTQAAHWIWFGQQAAGREAVTGSSRLSFVLLLMVTLSGLPESMKTLHANRAGHRDAGLWLANHAQPTDPIVDPFCWAHYYAGRVFVEGTSSAAPLNPQAPTWYVVLEGPDREHARLPLIPEARALAARGQLVYHWPHDKPITDAKVFVYAVHP
jgi:hypothetical protein